MWILEKPLLDNALADIARVIAESDGILEDTDKPVLNKIYRLYDMQGGTLTEEQDAVLSEAKRNDLCALYMKTQEGRKLSYIRTQLFKAVDVCPLCGMQPPSQLDHQMPKSKFKSLSVCRMNLVPICGVCNNKKSASEASLFVHPYYDHELQDLPFFVVEIHSSPVTHRMSWKFSVNEKVIGNPQLIKKINNQIGVIKLYRRLYKETNSILSDMLYGAEGWNEETLNFMLHHQYESCCYRLGMNDWHTVFMKSLIDSPHFTLAEAKVFARQIVPANSGVNA